MREQRGWVGRLVGGWQLNGVYILTSGATYTPGQTSNATFGLGNTYLTAGDRPFPANPNADRRQVGISQIDAFFLNRFNAAKLAELQASNPGGFISLTALNATGEVLPVTLNDVKYVFNGPGAARIFGTPFGSAGRNIERGPILNQLNLGLFKNIKVVERLTVDRKSTRLNSSRANISYAVFCLKKKKKLTHALARIVGQLVCLYALLEAGQHLTPAVATSVTFVSPPALTAAYVTPPLARSDARL